MTAGEFVVGTSKEEQRFIAFISVNSGIGVGVELILCIFCLFDV